MYLVASILLEASISTIMTTSFIDSIAKQIYDSAYNCGPDGLKFIYVLNGYRIIGEIVNYTPSNLSAKTISIHIRKIVMGFHI